MWQVLQPQRFDVAVLGKVNDHSRKYSIATKLVNRLDGLLANVQFEAQPCQGVVGLDLVLLVVAGLFFLLEYLMIQWMIRGQLFLNLGTLCLLTDFRDVLVGVDLEGNPIVLVRISVSGVGSTQKISNEHYTIFPSSSYNIQ